MVHGICGSAREATENSDFFVRARRALSIANGIDPEYWGFGSEYELITAREARRRALLRSLDLRERVTFAYVGRLDPNQKGLDVLLDTLRHRSSFHDYNLLIVGDGSPALAHELKALAESMPDRIRFFGKSVPRSEVRDIMGAIDFVILPSRFEPFGLVQLEAMAMGTLPIASATGGHKDVIVDMGHDGCFGRLFPTGDAIALGRAIEEMACMRRDRSNEVNAMRIRAAAAARRYSDRAMARRYEELYASVLDVPKEFALI
jgi:glycogen synthase